MENSGCLSMFVYIRDGGELQYVLIGSPDSDCPCRDECFKSPDFVYAGSCIALPDGEESWRFIKEGLSGDGCPDDSC